ncbi:MAG TPA: M20/M25/M40 family metallo-hydrolase [Pyrinomonadaceae bacterium]|jgi:putative aminopeptidase FrvX|nr:M20/M25/M40 family metallo-hydrolase [Pyrinomonadaceae bacterium]
MKALRGSKLFAVQALLLFTLCAATAAPVSVRAQEGLKISTLEQLGEEFSSVPCKNEERLAAVKALFEKVGAPASDISIDHFKDVDNLVVLKRGTSTEKIVIGAHYDKVANGCGAIDNWTGIVALAHLYRSLKDVTLKKTLVFVAFGKEEKGLIGSHAMVGAIKKEELSQYCSMVNIDSLGLGPLQVADNMSSDKLGDLAAELALKMKVPLSRIVIENADADSSSFKGKKVPALTISGLNDDWRSVMHSSNDQPSVVNPTSVYLGYRLILYLLAHLEDSACTAYK